MPWNVCSLSLTLSVIWYFLKDDSLGLIERLGEDLFKASLSDATEPDDDRGLRVNLGLCILRPCKLIMVILQIWVCVNLRAYSCTKINANVFKNHPQFSCYIFNKIAVLDCQMFVTLICITLMNCRLLARSCTFSSTQKYRGWDCTICHKRFICYSLKICILAILHKLKVDLWCPSFL